MKLVSTLLTILSICFMPLQAVPYRPDMVIVCDDDPMDLYLAEHYMKDYHCVVDTCRKAEEGLKRVDENYYDYAFIDWQLDTMTAVDFVKKAVPKNVWIKWYVMSDFWWSVGSSTIMKDLWNNFGATAILKSSVRSTDNVPMKNFQQMLDLILKPKMI